MFKFYFYIGSLTLLLGYVISLSVFGPTKLIKIKLSLGRYNSRRSHIIKCCGKTSCSSIKKHWRENQKNKTAQPGEKSFLSSLPTKAYSAITDKITTSGEKIPPSAPEIITDPSEGTLASFSSLPITSGVSTASRITDNSIIPTIDVTAATYAEASVTTTTASTVISNPSTDLTTAVTTPTTPSTPLPTTTSSCACPTAACAVAALKETEKQKWSSPDGVFKPACGKQYFISTTLKTRNDAATECCKFDMKLLTVDDGLELSCLASMNDSKFSLIRVCKCKGQRKHSFAVFLKKTSSFWTYGSNEGCESTHFWCPARTPLDSVLWAAAQPSAPATNRCVSINLKTNANASLIDQSCSTTLPFICKAF
ncbi:uncharacterized protein LOC135934774 [Cloeon dipterum]|uniref:uncharacterized protein LOC135934774 n=1 Tax=Cloeon dipterum TaxID=197152 RepID=UPI00321FAE29